MARTKAVVLGRAIDIGVLLHKQPAGPNRTERTGRPVYSGGGATRKRAGPEAARLSPAAPRQGEAYARMGNITGAVEQMQLAVKSGDADFFALSSTEARLRELRKLNDELRREGVKR